jgi:DNA ligase (NAD+)
MDIDPQSENYAPDPRANSEGFPLAGKTFVVTGTLSASRSEFKKTIEKNGGKLSGSISSKTDYLLAGEGGGSKRKKAQDLSVTIINEEEFLALLK